MYYRFTVNHINVFLEGMNVIHIRSFYVNESTREPVLFKVLRFMHFIYVRKTNNRKLYYWKDI